MKSSLIAKTTSHICSEQYCSGSVVEPWCFVRDLQFVIQAPVVFATLLYNTE